jgi:hypothetical protein
LNHAEQSYRSASTQAAECMARVPKADCGADIKAETAAKAALKQATSASVAAFTKFNRAMNDQANAQRALDQKYQKNKRNRDAYENASDNYDNCRSKQLHQGLVKAGS